MLVYLWPKFTKRWIWSRPPSETPLPIEGQQAYTTINVCAFVGQNSERDGDGYGYQTSCLAYHVYPCSWGWCLIGETSWPTSPEVSHQAFTQTSCITSPKNGISSGRLNKHVAGKLSSFPEWSLNTNPDKLSDFSWEWPSSKYLGQLTNFPKSGIWFGRLFEHLSRQVV